MNDAVMGGGSSFLTRRAFKKVLKLHTWELLGTKKAKPVFNNICWMIQSMQTAVGYRFLLGEYFPLFLALPAPIDLTLKVLFIFQGGTPCCTSVVWRVVMSHLQSDFSFECLLFKAVIISPRKDRRKGSKNLWHFMVLISLCEAMSHTYVSTAPVGSKLFPFSFHYTCTGRRYSRQLRFSCCPS